MSDVRQSIITLIEKKGWTQKEAAKRARVSEATMSEIANGKTNPGMLTIQKFATAFGMNFSELLEYKGGAEREATKTIDETSDQRLQLIEWALKAENKPYLEFAYNVSKTVPADLLDKLKFIIDINTGGGNTSE